MQNCTNMWSLLLLLFIRFYAFDVNMYIIDSVSRDPNVVFRQIIGQLLPEPVFVLCTVSTIM